METEPPFLPDGFRLHTSDDGNFIRLEFVSDKQGSKTVIMTRAALPSLAVEIQKRISPEDATPIRPADLQPGTTYSLAGQQVGPLSGGGAVLTLFVELLDKQRGATIPIELPPRELEILIHQLSQYR